MFDCCGKMIEFQANTSIFSWQNDGLGHTITYDDGWDTCHVPVDYCPFCGVDLLAQAKVREITGAMAERLREVGGVKKVAGWAIHSGVHLEVLGENIVPPNGLRIFEIETDIEDEYPEELLIRTEFHNNTGYLITPDRAVIVEVAD